MKSVKCRSCGKKVIWNFFGYCWGCVKNWKKENKKKRFGLMKITEETKTKIDLCLYGGITVLVGIFLVWLVYQLITNLSAMILTPEEKFTNRLIFLGIILTWICWQCIIFLAEFLEKILELFLETLKKFKLKEGEKK